jgi:hypothetical protein
MDIWRYFRHTWTYQYTIVPGWTMMFLVRDQAGRISALAREDRRTVIAEVYVDDFREDGIISALITGAAANVKT